MIVPSNQNVISFGLYYLSHPVLDQSLLVYYVMLFQIFLLFSVLYANLVLLVLFVSMFSSLLKNPPLLKKRKLLNLNILSLNNMNILAYSYVLLLISQYSSFLFLILYRFIYHVVLLVNGHPYIFLIYSLFLKKKVIPCIPSVILSMKLLVFFHSYSLVH